MPSLFFSLFSAGGVTINMATAHPHQTPDGSVINLSVSFGLNSTYKIIQIPPSSGKASQNPLDGGKVLSTIKPKSGIGYVHSFGLTDNYRVTLNFCGSLILWIGDFFCFAGTNFCD